MVVYDLTCKYYTRLKGLAKEKLIYPQNKQQRKKFIYIDLEVNVSSYCFYSLLGKRPNKLDNFFPYKIIQTSLIFVRKARSLIRKGAFERGSTLVDK